MLDLQLLCEHRRRGLRLGKGSGRRLGRCSLRHGSCLRRCGGFGSLGRHGSCRRFGSSGGFGSSRCLGHRDGFGGVRFDCGNACGFGVVPGRICNCRIQRGRVEVVLAHRSHDTNRLKGCSEAGLVGSVHGSGRDQNCRDAAEKDRRRERHCNGNGLFTVWYETHGRSPPY